MLELTCNLLVVAASCDGAAPSRTSGNLHYGLVGEAFPGAYIGLELMCNTQIHLLFCHVFWSSFPNEAVETLILVLGESR